MLNHVGLLANGLTQRAWVALYLVIRCSITLPRRPAKQQVNAQAVIRRVKTRQRVRFTARPLALPERAHNERQDPDDTDDSEGRS